MLPALAALAALDLEALRLDVLGRLVLAVILGGAIGLEREQQGKEAGLRTHILICLGAALFTVISVEMIDPAGNWPPGDVSRIAANVVTGVGFIGAGVILQSRGRVRGLTTAATIWTVAALGVAAGAAQYVAAVGATVLMLVVLIPLRWWERRSEASEPED
ncbi:MAG TPA: MgtC/SapB family protein [Longimicrobiales bacterium]|nr:MgtC/SapB family protein [Longimicrobiales bacterium]